MLPLTIRHRFDFGTDAQLIGRDLGRPEAWDALRTQTAGPFMLPDTRQAFEAQLVARPDLQRRADEVHRLLPSGTIASYGVGGATLELALHKLGRRLVLGEYAPMTVDRLRTVLPEIPTRQHNVLKDGPLDADWHLWHRIDTEFTNRQWRLILKRFSRGRVLVVASELLPGHRIWDELRRPGARAGWLRNRAAFERLWRHTHHAERLRVADLHGWLLIPRR